MMSCRVWVTMGPFIGWKSMKPAGFCRFIAVLCWPGLGTVFAGPKITYRTHPNLWLGLAVKRIDLDGDVAPEGFRVDGGGPQIDGRIEFEVSPRVRLSERWQFDSRHRVELIHLANPSDRTRFRHQMRWTRSLGGGSSSVVADIAASQEGRERKPRWSHVLFSNEVFHEDGDTLFEINDFIQQKGIRDTARLGALNRAEEAAKTLDEELQHVFSTHQEFIQKKVADMSSSEQSLSSYLCKVLADAPILSGVGAAFLPRRFSDEKYLFAPYCREQQKLASSGDEEVEEIVQIEDFYDYTLPEYDSYHLPLIQKQDVWQEPHLSRASREWVLVGGISGI